MSPDCAVLLHTAKLYIVYVCETKEHTQSIASTQSVVSVVQLLGSENALSSSILIPPTSLQRFKFLANKIQSSKLTSTGSNSSVSERDAIHTHLHNYIA
jgi:hypothetical protein